MDRGARCPPSRRTPSPGPPGTVPGVPSAGELSALPAAELAVRLGLCRILMTRSWVSGWKNSSPRRGPRWWRAGKVSCCSRNALTTPNADPVAVKVPNSSCTAWRMPASGSGTTWPWWSWTRPIGRASVSSPRRALARIPPRIRARRTGEAADRHDRDPIDAQLERGGAGQADVGQRGDRRREGHRVVRVDDAGMWLNTTAVTTRQPPHGWAASRVRSVRGDRRDSHSRAISAAGGSQLILLRHWRGSGHPGRAASRRLLFTWASGLPGQKVLPWPASGAVGVWRVTPGD